MKSRTIVNCCWVNDSRQKVVWEVRKVISIKLLKEWVVDRFMWTGSWKYREPVRTNRGLAVCYSVTRIMLLCSAYDLHCKVEIWIRTVTLENHSFKYFHASIAISRYMIIHWYLCYKRNHLIQDWYICRVKFMGHMCDSIEN